MTVPTAAPLATATTGRPEQDHPGTDDARRAYHQSLQESTRSSALLAGIILLVAFPLWSVFDLLVLPHRAATFITVRLIFEIPIALTVVALRAHEVGRRLPEQTAFTLLVLPQVAIAWMVPRSQPELPAYLLGFSLVIFGSAVLMVWRWQLTAWLAGATLMLSVVSTLTARPALDTPALATIMIYLGTAGIVSVVGQFYRYRSGYHQFVTQAALERERRRNDTLVEELRRLSGEDPLTGVANRRAWELWAMQEHLNHAGSDQPFAVVLCDFDHFKLVNDTYGHGVGDEVLRAGAAAIRMAARSTDLVARLGGDEFIVGCPGADLATASDLAHRLAATARTLRWPADITMTLSAGVAVLSPADVTVADLLARADAALYEAKSTRNTVALAPTGHVAPRRRLRAI